MITRKEKYNKIIRSYRWQKLRSEYLTLHPVCELCDKKDKTSLAVEVHHITPIESVMDFPSMERLAYNMENLQALCRECHETIHKEMNSQGHSKENSRKYAKETAKNFLEWLSETPPQVKNKDY